MMNILTIGDIHGRDNWVKFTHGSQRNYDLWKLSVESGAPAHSTFWKDMPFMQFEKIIFIGDYVDSFRKKNFEILQNLKEIIYFKKALQDRVVLLLGNHDVQYMFPNNECSGFRPEMKFDLSEIFNENLGLFKYAHQEKNYLWSHAGITSGWFNYAIKTIQNPKHRFYLIISEFFEKDRTIADIVNLLGEIQSKTMHTVDVYSGGIDAWASPLWVRPQILNNWSLEGYNQIVGHTPQEKIVIVTGDDEGNKFEGYKIWYIDCLGKNKVLITDV